LLGPVKHAPRSRSAAFTLIELMIVIAIVAIVASLAGPRFSEYIVMQRLRSVQAQLVTDLGYARSEAVSRGTFVQVRVQADANQTCYIIYSRSDAGTNNTCDCTAAVGSRCSGGPVEIKTVSLPANNQVMVAVPTGQTDPLTISPRTGGTNMVSVTEALNVTDFTVETQIDAQRRFRTSMSPQGRLLVCSPTVATVGGVAC
jgi:type IV fimbrial biogenesis protein FimT